MSNNPSSHNPYASAAGTYAQNAQSNSLSQRDLEARVLLKAAQKMKVLQEDWDNVSLSVLDDVLRYNRQIWLMFVDTAVEDDADERPIELRNNIANLGVFVFKRTLDVLAAPEKEKLNILVEINQQIAAGLSTKSSQKSDDSKAGQGEKPPVMSESLNVSG